MGMTRITTTVLAAVLGCSGVLAVGSAAGASAPFGCQYKVLWPTAGVYENPNPNS
ncbi:glycosyltransferase, partial [Streptomyces sp. SID8455]|nr:glycosyltransferase [Streptomyces sp. SID8455]